MILVTDVRVVEQSEEELFKVIYHYDPEYPPDLRSSDDPMATTDVLREVIKGRKFYNADGKRIAIGWDEKTQEALGLPFETFERQEFLLTEYRKRLQSLFMELHALKSETLFGFLKRKMRALIRRSE